MFLVYEKQIELWVKLSSFLSRSNYCSIPISRTAKVVFFPQSNTVVLSSTSRSSFHFPFLQKSKIRFRMKQTVKISFRYAGQLFFKSCTLVCFYWMNRLSLKFANCKLYKYNETFTSTEYCPTAFIFK